MNQFEISELQTIELADQILKIIGTKGGPLPQILNADQLTSHLITITRKALVHEEYNLVVNFLISEGLCEWLNPVDKYRLCLTKDGKIFYSEGIAAYRKYKEEHEIDTQILKDELLQSISSMNNHFKHSQTKIDTQNIKKNSPKSLLTKVMIWVFVTIVAGIISYYLGKLLDKW